MALMNPESITDNVKYNLGTKTLLILVYDDKGKEIANKLFVIGYKHGRPVIKITPPFPPMPTATDSVIAEQKNEM